MNIAWKLYWTELDLIWAQKKHQGEIKDTNDKSETTY